MASTMKIAGRQAKAMEPQHREVNKIKATPRQHTSSRHANYSHSQNKGNVNSSHNQNINAVTLVANTYIKTSVQKMERHAIIVVCRKRKREKAQVHEIDQEKIEEKVNNQFPTQKHYLQ